MTEIGFRDDFRRNFFTGVAALFPILITIFLISWLYIQVDRTIGAGTNLICRELLIRNGTVFRLVFGADAGLDGIAARRAYAQDHFPRVVGTVVGIVALLVLIYLIGGFLRGYVGRRLIRALDGFFERFPVIKAIYPHARQVGDLLFGQRGRRRFSRVVAVEYPRRGIYSLGFQTGDGVASVARSAGRKLVTVFVPTSPTPLTGFVIVLPPEDVISLEMTVDEAFRYFITAGMLVSPRQQPGEFVPDKPSPESAEEPAALPREDTPEGGESD